MIKHAVGMIICIFPIFIREMGNTLRVSIVLIHVFNTIE